MKLIIKLIHECSQPGKRIQSTRLMLIYPDSDPSWGCATSPKEFPLAAAPWRGQFTGSMHALTDLASPLTISIPRDRLLAPCRAGAWCLEFFYLPPKNYGIPEKNRMKLQEHPGVGPSSLTVELHPILTHRSQTRSFGSDPH
ncbi:hypothetical protein PAPYR_6569 [Paratrimastix pyriformis]|uniref:Uncharacterized protein n=1 Tax=Paratrimastix pyriformis TaxID=342808 RepID=A0ABQ8UMA0_9EUKA|nr:hypothetical protein PAPYR_6569 [Paratrimastix pyriformis]